VDPLRGELDGQDISPSGTVDDVRAAVQRVRDALGGEQGDVIGQAWLSKVVPLGNTRASFEAWGADPRSDAL